MIKKALRNLSQGAEKYRLALWILLLLFTITILLFPVQLKYEYHPVQSTYIFGDNLPLFAALYCVWMLLLLVLIFSRREAKWEKLALVCVFAIVFLGFWAIITPHFRHSDEWYRAAHIQYLLDYGTINLTHQYLQYFDFPGLQLFGTAFCQITGLNIFIMRTIFVLFLAVLLAALLYVLFLRSLKNPSIAATGVLLFFLANMLLSKGSLLFSSHLAYVFIVSFLILLNRREHAFLETSQDKLIMIILLMATTVTHFMTSVALVLIILGIYLVKKLDKKTTLVSLNLFVLSLISVSTFLIFWATRTFTGLITPIPLLFSGGFTLSGLFLGAGAAVGSMGGGVPLWALITKLSWWAFIYGFGSILWIKWFFRLKKLSSLEKICVGGLAGIVMYAIVATLVGAQGYQGVIRYLMYAAFFTIPFILRFFLNLDNYKRRLSIALLAIMLFALALPTFFVNNDMIKVDASYPSEISSREFLRSNYDEGKDLTVVSTVFSLPLNVYYLPEAGFKYDPDYFYLKERDELWIHLNALVDMVTIPDERVKHDVREYAVFIYSQRLIGAYEHMLGIKPTNPEWLELKNRLLLTGNSVYNNGDVQLFLFPAS